MKQKQEEENNQLLILTNKSKLVVPQFKRIQQPCQTCFRELAKYSCPKCQGMHCSLDCYKSHSETCTKTFQKEHEMAKMKGYKASIEDQIKMRRTLNNLYEEQKNEPINPMNEEAEFERLQELRDLCQQNKLHVDLLTPNEQVEFAKFIETMVVQEPWTPWWEVEDGMFSLYVDEDCEYQYSENPYLEFRSTLKLKIKTIVPFNKICRIQHDDLRNHLFNLVQNISLCSASIAIISRVIDGELVDLNREFYNMFNTLCYTMEDNTNLIGNLDLSYKKLKENANKIDKSLILPYINKQDLVKIFSQKFFVIEILFQAYDSIHSIEHLARQEENVEFAESKQLFKTLHQKKQKLLFYISYALSKNNDFYQQLRTEIKELNE